MSIRFLVLGGALLLSAAAVGGCKTQDLHPADGGVGPTHWTGSWDPLHRNVDVLFVVDDSSDMALAQNNLIANFPTFMATLQGDPAGPASIHIAVVSSDMGAGDGTIPGCDNSDVAGAGGIFRYTPRGTCTASNLQAGATFISNVSGVPNYSGNVEDVFGCIAALGESGCGFGQPFAAALRALGGDGFLVPAENQGFLRPEAALAIVMLTNQDDCSAAPGVPIFDTTANKNMASQLGPPTHFRCNEFGHLCAVGGGAPMHPNRAAPGVDVNATVTYDACTSNDTEGYLLAAKQTADQIRALKTDASRIVVASIQGAPSSYAVHWTAPGTPDTSCGSDSCPWPAITHACHNSDGRYGDPGVRTAQLTQEFGINGLQLSVCDSSLGPNLEQIARLINRALGPSCLPGQVALNSAGEPDCKVTETLPWATTEPATVPACADSNGAAPCWQLETIATCPGQSLNVSIDPNVNNPSNFITINYDCRKQ